MLRLCFIQVVLEGRLTNGACGKDVIITLCGLYNNEEVLNAAIEFAGSGVAALSMDDRLSIANMTTEWGALSGLFPMDDVLKGWIYLIVGAGSCAQAQTLAGMLLAKVSA